MFALDYQMDCILEEGLEARFERHAAMAKRVQNWAKEHFALYSDPDHLSQTVTCITNTQNFDFGAFNQKLGERGFAISNGYGALKGKTFRIAHMGDVTMADIDELLTVIEDVVKEM